MFNVRWLTHTFSWTRVVITLALAVVCASASKMSSELQEAIYQFELKGNTDAAIRLLQKVEKEGDTEDQNEAAFYLAKIYDLAGKRTEANQYYQQSLQKTKNTHKAYWIAEQEALTAQSPETIIKKKFLFKSPIQKIFPGPTPYFLLQNGSVQIIQNNAAQDLKIALPEESQILLVNSLGYWHKNGENDSLFFQPHHSQSPLKSFPIRSVQSVFEYGDHVIVQNENTLYLLSKKSIKFQISDKYNNCSIEGFYSTTGHFVLNCPDNALHLISAEDGSETYTIAQLEPIQHVVLDKENIVFSSGSILFSYQPRKGPLTKWKKTFSNIENIIPFESHYIVLEASGRITLLDKETGYSQIAVRTDATIIAPLAQGTLGLFSNEGSITAIDTLLRPLWHFNLARPISRPPERTEDGIHLILNDREVVCIAPHYYGGHPLLSDFLIARAAEYAEKNNWAALSSTLDSIFKLEPGNAEGWFYKALYLEKNNGTERERQKAWSEAVRLSVSNPQITPVILNRYSKAIGAKFVSILNVSPRTMYPKFFGNKKNLFTVDPAAERLLCLNPDNGELRWSRILGKMDNSPVMANDDNTLAIAAGFNIDLYDLSKEHPPTTLQLPGKAFEIQMSNNVIYVSTWNGFLVKIIRSENRTAWSRKIYSVPFLFSLNGETIHLSTLEGEITHLWDASGQIKDSSSKLPANVSSMVSTDSNLIIATNTNRLYLYEANNLSKEPTLILMEASVTSLQALHYKGKNYFLVGLSNQSILLYTEQGAPLWKFQGKNSIFTTPVIYEDYAWLDQGNEVIAISLKEGTVEKRYKTPGHAGTPFIQNNTLYSASPKRILYGFSL